MPRRPDDVVVSTTLTREERDALAAYAKRQRIASMSALLRVIVNRFVKDQDALELVVEARPNGGRRR